MIEIKYIRDMSDYKKLPEIQKSAWSFDDIDVEPHYLITRVQKYGGLVQGLYLDNGLIGFTYATIGKWEGQYFIYSHMTAVKREHQGKGFGFLLKKAQREEVLKMGYDLIRWNFDPLESLNSYFNLHRLGVISIEYERDIYGTGESGIHKGLSTDRLIATWDLNSERVKEKMMNKQPSIKEDIYENSLNDFKNTVAYIEIPKDIRMLKQRYLNEAIEWRQNTREHFELAFQKGFVAKDVVFSKDMNGIYIRMEK